MKDLLLKEARTRILDLIKVRGTLSVDEVTRDLDLSKTTIREHLLLLEEQGLVLREYKSAGRGRPQLLYRLAPQAQALYPSQEPALLKELVRELIASGQQEWLKRFFKSYWSQRQEIFERRLAELGKSDHKTRLDTLTEMLRSEGFMPRVEKHRSGKLTVRECNCPFREVISATQLPCLHEAKFIESALCQPVTRVSYIPEGNPTCTYEFGIEFSPRSKKWGR